jgi:hypothetical protein
LPVCHPDQRWLARSRGDDNDQLSPLPPLRRKPNQPRPSLASARQPKATARRPGASPLKPTSSRRLFLLRVVVSLPPSPPPHTLYYNRIATALTTASNPPPSAARIRLTRRPLPPGAPGPIRRPVAGAPEAFNPPSAAAKRATSEEL